LNNSEVPLLQPNLYGAVKGAKEPGVTASEHGPEVRGTKMKGVESVGTKREDGSLVVMVFVVGEETFQNNYIPRAWGT
jgi:hypothetical protein